MRRFQQTRRVIFSALADACLIMLAYFLSVWLRIEVLAAGKPENFDLVLAPKSVLAAAIAAVVMLVLYSVAGLYAAQRDTTTGQELTQLAAANALGVLAIGTALFMFRLDEFSRSALFYFYLLSCALVFVKRTLHRRWVVRARLRGEGCSRLLLVGSGTLAQRYYDTVVKDAQYGYTFKGYFAPHMNSAMPAYQGDCAGLRAALKAGGVDEVVFAMETADTALIGAVVSACGRFGVRVSIIPPYSDFIPSTPRVEPQAGLKRMTVRSAPDKGVVWVLVKRTMDIGISLVGLVVLSPIMLGAAIAVRVSSPGPVVFRQMRAGKYGKLFPMYKFRSMYADAERRLTDLQDQNESDGPTFKIANDPRITPVGRFLRKTSIDELPQLINVLQGYMSVVGPRPPLLREVEQYSDWDWGRLTVKPGLTCFWQISGRSNISFADWMKLDLKYVEEQGFWTDVKILCQTVWVVLSGKGAY